MHILTNKLFEKVLWHLYRVMLRRLLPGATQVLYHGVPVGIDRKPLDSYFPSYKQLSADIPQYEATLIDGIKTIVRPGDHVTIIGGGFGVTLVFAALTSSPGGRVTCYEASASAIRTITETLKRSEILGGVTFIHAIVGKALNLYGAGLSGTVVDARDIKPCDVLELDCEGAELEILQDLSIRPRTILVETHGVYGSATADVAAQLEKMRYTVTDLGPAEPRISEKCAEWDLKVLRADRDDSAIA